MYEETLSDLKKWKTTIDNSGGKTYFVFAREVTFQDQSTVSKMVSKKVATPKPGAVIFFSKTEITLSNYAKLLQTGVKAAAGVPTQLILGRVGRKTEKDTGAYLLKYHYSKIEVTEKDMSALRLWGQGAIPFLRGATFKDSKKASFDRVGAVGLAKELDPAVTAAAKKVWLASGATAKKNFASMVAVIKADAEVRASPELRAAVAALKVARVEEYTKGLDAAFTRLEAVAPKKAGAPLEKPLEYAKALRDFRKELKNLYVKFNNKHFRAIDFENPWGNTFNVTPPIDQGFRELMRVYLPLEWKPYVRS